MDTAVIVGTKMVNSSILNISLILKSRYVMMILYINYFISFKNNNK